jgi:hypothetical protein
MLGGIFPHTYPHVPTSLQDLPNDDIGDPVDDAKGHPDHQYGNHAAVVFVPVAVGGSNRTPRPGALTTGSSPFRFHVLTVRYVTS